LLGSILGEPNEQMGCRTTELLPEFLGCDRRLARPDLTLETVSKVTEPESIAEATGIPLRQDERGYVERSRLATIGV
jgi:hypothetical protein